jgi:hypothetical protein
MNDAQLIYDERIPWYAELVRETDTGRNKPHPGVRRRRAL